MTSVSPIDLPPAAALHDGLLPSSICTAQLQGLHSLALFCAVIAFLLLPSLGYTEPFLRGCLGFTRLPLLSSLRSLWESPHFAVESRQWTGQNGGVVMELFGQAMDGGGAAPSRGEGGR